MDEKLYRAAVEGDVRILKKARSEEYFLGQTYQKNNFFHVAIRHKQYDFIKAALESFPSPDVVYKLIYQSNCDGNTPLHVVAELGLERILDLLSKYDGQADMWSVQNNKGNTPLHVALIYCNSWFAVFLLEKHPQLARVCNKSKETPLHLAVRFQRHSYSSIACWQDANGFTPLLRAASSKHRDFFGVVQLILKSHPKSAEVCDFTGKTILHHLINNKLDISEVKRALDIPEVKCLVNYRDHDGNMPSHLAVRNNDFELIRVLSGYGADFRIPNDEGVSAEQLFKQLNASQFTDIYEALCADMQQLTKSECEMIEAVNKNFLREKLSNLAFTKKRASDGRNILHILMQSPSLSTSSNREFCKYFIREILDPLIFDTDHQGNNPFHYLAKSDASTQVIASIINLYNECVFPRRESESPWLMKNDQGNTPLHEICKKFPLNLQSAIEIWRTTKEAISCTNNFMETPLHLLASSNIAMDPSWNDLDELIRNGLELGALEIRDKAGLTPFERAVRNQSWALVTMLSGISPNLLLDQHPGDGNTALHLALQKGQFDTAKTLLTPTYYGVQKKNWQDRLLSVTNKEGVTPSDIISYQKYIPSEFETFLRNEGQLLGRRSMYGIPAGKAESYTNTVGVTAALLATVTFTAGFTLPGGLNQDKGTPIFMRKAAFQVFMVSNLLALCLSMMVLFCLLWVMTTRSVKETILLLDTSIMLLQASFYATLFTFMMGVYVTTITITPWIAILSCALCSSVILLMHKWFINRYLSPYCGILKDRSAQIGNHVEQYASELKKKIGGWLCNLKKLCVGS